MTIIAIISRYSKIAAVVINERNLATTHVRHVTP